ncbi:periplasmic binding protein-like II [Thozetella sp. PMI_491]|nr:periplasmic binding protein-like II [Thozetella sp. PMI_491]
MRASFLVPGLLAPLPFLVSGALKISSALSTIEYTPEAIAIKDFFKGSASISNGGVANIVSDKTIDLASNAETQALRQYATHKNLRIIYTVCEVTYRIVANGKSGIKNLKDLKGKKIATMQSTSAAYFVERLLATAGLGPSDYTIVSGNMCSAAPCGSGTYPYQLAHGTVDAVGMWEPSIELAVEALGSNAVVFQNRTVYREVFNLHSTADKLKDAATRKEIVAFVKALHQAEKMFDTEPEQVWPRVAQLLNMNSTLLKGVWPIHSWKGGLPADLLDVLEDEDKWVAKVDRRSAMSRAELSNLIDDSVLKEALQA